ncbi:MAG: hypothetical protein L6R42_006571 [Xanthoria sp. 1 TBL-2021]|nr:MAG: hypothetical protein L6R42_006571 [Xanthoria sp. 1 TBL-2021]
MPAEPRRAARHDDRHHFKTMTEPRARAARHKGQLNFEKELRGLLFAHGDDEDPLPETVRVLDEITTDFIIETCHAASRHATLNGRQKVKLEDFKFVVRKDDRLLGRMMELIGMEKELKEARKGFNTDEGKVGLERSGPKKRRRTMKVGEKEEDGEGGEDAEEGDDGMEDMVFGPSTSIAG